MTREEAIALVRRYGAAIKEGRTADAAEHGMAIVEALMKAGEKA